MPELPPLDPDVVEQLERDDPSALAAYERKRKAALDARFPMPTLGDIRNLADTLRSEWADYTASLNDHRELRFQLDQTPSKYRQQLESADEKGQVLRVHSRLGHNEIMRVVANQTRNPWRVEIPPHGPGEKADGMAEAQTRFANQLLATWERMAGKPLRRLAVDSQASSGMGIWELYLTDAYDDIDFDEREVDEYDEQGNVVGSRPESDKEYMSRTEESILAAGFPVGARVLDEMAVRIQWDGQGIKRVVIHEYKPYLDVYAEILERYSRHPERIHEMQLPDPDVPGVSVDDLQGLNATNGMVECIRYYDRRWYCEYVGEYPAIEPQEHGFHRIPIFVQEGMVTNSPRPEQRYQGVTWGMDQMERRINDMLTLGVDISYAFARPHPVVLTPLEGRQRMSNGKDPDVLDLSDPGRVPQLEPGQTIADAFAGFKPNLQFEILSELNRLYQLSGLNPIASGQSPGSDPAGYTVNALQGASLANYEVLVDNEARCASEMVDWTRYTLKHVVRERAYIAAPKRGKGGSQHIEWLALGPNQITDVPCTVTVDPMSDTQRLAVRQSLLEGYQNKLVPRRMVQEKGFGADDADLWDDEILRDGAMERIAAMMIDTAMQQLQMVFNPQAMMAQMGMAEGMPDPSASPGAMPAPVQPPTVGAAAGEASQGPPGIQPSAAQANAARARGGQANGYQPAPGAAGTTAAQP